MLSPYFFCFFGSSPGWLDVVVIVGMGVAINGRWEIVAR